MVSSSTCMPAIYANQNLKDKNAKSVLEYFNGFVPTVLLYSTVNQQQN